MARTYNLQILRRAYKFCEENYYLMKTYSVFMKRHPLYIWAQAAQKIELEIMSSSTSRTGFAGVGFGC
jgi:hypothetical protein